MDLLKKKQTELRNKRSYQCFQIINRGKLWYESLTKEQLKELEEWYQKWLDVTVTLQEPKKPNWLN